MKFKHFFISVILLMFTQPLYADIVEGGISKNGAFNQIYDSNTNMPVQNAKISLPQKNYTTYTDSNGAFSIDTQINDSSVMSVEKQGYRPYSITINEKIAANPIIIGIEKTNAQDIIINSQMIHLGDDNFSDASANSSEFQIKSSGPYYSKTFQMTYDTLRKKNYLVIGTIIGVDTLMARTMKQNSIVNSFSSPPVIYFNGQKIAEIQLNGDGQRVRLPNNLIKTGQNEITIRTGKNMQRTDYIDYDDIEFMNLSIVTE